MKLKIGQKLLERVSRSMRGQERNERSPATSEMHFCNLHRKQKASAPYSN
jgi:hypothetical protein